MKEKIVAGGSILDNLYQKQAKSIQNLLLLNVEIQKLIHKLAGEKMPVEIKEVTITEIGFVNQYKGALERLIKLEQVMTTTKVLLDKII